MHWIYSKEAGDYVKVNYEEGEVRRCQEGLCAKMNPKCSWETHYHIMWEMVEETDENMMNELQQALKVRIRFGTFL